MGIWEIIRVFLHFGLVFFVKARNSKITFTVSKTLKKETFYKLQTSCLVVNFLECGRQWVFIVSLFRCFSTYFASGSATISLLFTGISDVRSSVNVTGLYLETIRACCYQTNRKMELQQQAFLTLIIYGKSCYHHLNGMVWWNVLYDLCLAENVAGLT